MVFAVSSENIDLVRRLIESFNRDDVDATWAENWELFAEDIEVWPAPGFPEAGPFQGRHQYRVFFDGLRGGWKETSVVVRELEDAGDKVLASVQWRAIGETSGVETSSDWLVVFTIRGGHIACVQFFSDHDAAIDAAGLR